MERPRVPIIPEKGDYVHATYVENGEAQITTSFWVTKISGTVFEGASSAIGLIDTGAGWEITVGQKGNPALPTRLARIAAVFENAPISVVKLIGNGADWQIDGGKRVDIRGIVGWMLWSDYEAKMAKFDAWKLKQAEAERAGTEEPLTP